MTRAVVLLAISDDIEVCSLLKKFLDAEGHQAICVSSPLEALELLNRGVSPDFVLLDVARNKTTNRLFDPALLEKIKSHQICILSEIGDASWKDRALEWDIQSVLIKPLLRRDLERLIYQSVQVESEPCPLTGASPIDGTKMHLEDLENNRFFLAASPSMLQIYKDVRLLAPVDVPVLILGESGVGKEVIAMLLHKYHARAGKKIRQRQLCGTANGAPRKRIVWL